MSTGICKSPDGRYWRQRYRGIANYRSALQKPRRRLCYGRRNCFQAAGSPDGFADAHSGKSAQC
jgi:hypothetical protein